jgi:SAM-dependent methyltransferase
VVTGASSQEELNRATWSKTAAQQDLLRGAAFTDPGERVAFTHVLDDVRGRPILDLGVGMGRTVPILKPLASEYHGIDFVPAMVEATRRAHPDASIALGDARSLSELEGDHFGMVVFSYNGIDAVPSADRRKVFRAVHRVLAPRGVFLFSTLNLDGPSFRERPWKVRVWPPATPLGAARQALRQLVGAPRDLVNWMKIRHGGARGPGFAVAPLSAHHYGVLAHYTTLERQLRELADEGFAADPLVFDNARGDRVLPGAGTRDIDWFHIVATRA